MSMYMPQVVLEKFRKKSCRNFFRKNDGTIYTFTIGRRFDSGKMVTSSVGNFPKKNCVLTVLTLSIVIGRRLQSCHGVVSSSLAIGS